MVDFGFCGRAPLGTDLGQLVLGEVQTGHRRVANLPDLEAACLDAYVAGVAAEGGGADAARLQRSHAVLMTVFAALSAVPVEHLDADPTPGLRRLVRARTSVLDRQEGLLSAGSASTPLLVDLRDQPLASAAVCRGPQLPHARCAHFFDTAAAAH